MTGEQVGNHRGAMNRYWGRPPGPECRARNRTFHNKENPMDSLNDMTLAQLDPQIRAVLDAELERQRATLEMIASEN